jgi:DNA-binding SARP family transcriptional activator
LQHLLETTDQSMPIQAQVIQLLGEIGDERVIPVLDRLRRQRVQQTVAQAALQRIADRPAPPLRVYTLGGFQVWRGNVLIPIEAWQQRRKARLLLLYLLTQRRRQVPRDELLDTLWPDLTPDSAGLALNTTFSDLRKLLEPYLGKGMPSRYVTHEGDCYFFNTASDTWYDAYALEEAVRSAKSSSHVVLELYRGDFLPEEPYEDWVIRERERLRSIHLNALTDCLEQQLQQGAWREGSDIARRVLDREPWLEEVWRALITCYARLGRRSEALQAYLTCEHNLRQELDVAPSAETRLLYDQLKA